MKGLCLYHRKGDFFCFTKGLNYMRTTKGFNYIVLKTMKPYELYANDLKYES